VIFFQSGRNGFAIKKNLALACASGTPRRIPDAPFGLGQPLFSAAQRLGLAQTACRSLACAHVQCLERACLLFVRHFMKFKLMHSLSTKELVMQLGLFSTSLTVKDIGASREFYEKLGFTVFGGNAEHNWLIMKNGEHLIGLFKGMFEKNMLTFNPGWDANTNEVNPFTDVRELQRRLKEQGVELLTSADESTTGPASFTIVDPDGNPILVDQHR